MRTKPDVADERLVDCARSRWGLDIEKIAFLALGDANSAPYRVDAGRAYFLKLRRGDLVDSEAPVLVPRFLADRGVANVIPPIPTLDGTLRASLDGWAVTLYPYVEGRDAYERPLSDREWAEFGAAVRAVHAAQPPPEVAALLPREEYSPAFRETVRERLASAGRDEPRDGIGAALDDLLLANAKEIRRLVDRAERLAAVLRDRPPALVLCHTDIHARNLLITDDATVYLIDWDEPALAPKERDLMFIGGGVADTWNTPREEEEFYRGYGTAEVDAVALAYYRCERIVQDIAAFCDEALDDERGEADRQRALRLLGSLFLPGSVLEIARRTADALPS